MAESTSSASRPTSLAQASAVSKLALAPRVVAGADRGAAAPVREVGEGAFAEVPFTADTEHDLEADAAVELGRRGLGEESEVGGLLLLAG